MPKPPAEKRSEHKHVFWNKTKNKWSAQINVRGKKIHFGYAYTDDEAYNIYLKCMERIHEYIPLPESPTKMKIKFIKPKLSISDDEIDV